MKATAMHKELWHDQHLALCCLLSTAPTMCHSFSHSCPEMCIHSHVHAVNCMSKRPSVCMFLTSFSHSHVSKGSEHSPGELWALLLQSNFQKQNHAVCSSHAWQGHVCCQQMPHPNGGLKTSLSTLCNTIMIAQAGRM